jgi:hypothetical protein
VAERVLIPPQLAEAHQSLEDLVRHAGVAPGGTRVLDPDRRESESASASTTWRLQHGDGCNGYGALKKIVFPAQLQGFEVGIDLELFRVPSGPIPQLEGRTVRKSPRPAVMTRASGTQLLCGGCMTIISLIDVVSLVLTAIVVGITIGGQLRP